jgi:hypothetical protein
MISARSSTAVRKGVPCLALPLPGFRGEGRLVAFKRQKAPKWDQKGGQEVPRPIEKIPKNTHDFSNSDSEKILSRKFHVGRGGSKEPPGGNIYFWAAISPLGALRARPVNFSWYYLGSHSPPRSDATYEVIQIGVCGLP